VGVVEEQSSGRTGPHAPDRASGRDSSATSRRVVVPETTGARQPVQEVRSARRATAARTNQFIASGPNAVGDQEADHSTGSRRARSRPVHRHETGRERPAGVPGGRPVASGWTSRNEDTATREHRVEATGERDQVPPFADGLGSGEDTRPRLSGHGQSPAHGYLRQVTLVEQDGERRPGNRDVRRNAYAMDAGSGARVSSRPDPETDREEQLPRGAAVKSVRPACPIVKNDVCSRIVVSALQGPPGRSQTRDDAAFAGPGSHGRCTRGERKFPPAMKARAVGIARMSVPSFHEVWSRRLDHHGRQPAAQTSASVQSPERCPGCSVTAMTATPRTESSPFGMKPRGTRLREPGRRTRTRPGHRRGAN
jgi:hypothetical protein